MAFKTTTSSSPKCSVTPRNPVRQRPCRWGLVQARREVRIQVPQKKSGIHPCKHKDRAQLRNRFLSFMCSSYRLNTVREGSDDQSCWLGQLLTFGECYEIHSDKSPLTLKFLLGRLEKGDRFKKWEFEEVEKRYGSCMAFQTLPREPYGGLLPGLFPSSQVGRVQRRPPVPLSRVMRSLFMPEVPSPKFQEYQSSDGSTFSGRFPPGIFPKPLTR